jgi:hypothetical protein
MIRRQSSEVCASGSQVFAVKAVVASRPAAMTSAVVVWNVALDAPGSSFDSAGGASTAGSLWARPGAGS